MEIPGKLPFSKRRLRPRVVLSYIFDYVILMQPTDPASGKRKLRGPWRWKDRLWEMNCGILGLLLSQGLAFVITQVLKNACGKPRPDIIDRCQPRAGSHDLSPYGLSNSTICTGEAALIKDGFRSWPSGHSSSSFAGLFYTSMWLGGKLHIMDNRGETWKTLLVMIPILAATLVAVSRIMDARHHPFDVITGSLLGVACAIVSYHQYFPPLSEAWRKGRAYPIRTWGSQPTHPVHGKLDSESESITTPLRNPEADRLNPPDLRHSLASPNISASGTTGYGENPYAPAAYPRRSHDHDPDGNWSSSEDDVANGYEMQQGYATTANPAARGYSPSFETNTAYASPRPVPSTDVHRPNVVVSPTDRGRQLTDVAVGNV
ncbi:uncharacterized protein N7477_001859 [Penicillium maclennaniae]|uniref:uncharacterized protein n=1 Tax=Penicillium maclennaniae TaxID=1343394 RepID=UPI0025410BF0|nr:uncharacterized protein N7477_001859 [Penicillium maclennaniae]KAJ5681919.1 hypothetical protein N7477_001859 [Penicillium maclennaniae]